MSCLRTGLPFARVRHYDLLMSFKDSDLEYFYLLSEYLDALKAKSDLDGDEFLYLDELSLQMIVELMEEGRPINEIDDQIVEYCCQLGDEEE